MLQEERKNPGSLLYHPIPKFSNAFMHTSALQIPFSCPLGGALAPERGHVLGIDQSTLIVTVSL